MESTTQLPWYREPWPWLLMAGPAGVVAAGIVTLWLALGQDDGLVADDYYKQGLAINRVIARDAQARALGVAAELRFRAGGVSVVLQGDGPAALELSMRHPTRAGQDRTVRLRPLGGGAYEGEFDVPAQGRWHVVLSDADARWRLAGDWSIVQGPRISLGALPGSAQR